MSERNLMLYKWEWHWQENNGEAECGIYAMVRTGHAYSVAKCPRYMPREQWEEIAEHICKIHNEAISK